MRRPMRAALRASRQRRTKAKEITQMCLMVAGGQVERLTDKRGCSI
ncbi:hypothetical protein KP509_14G072000 [Ceratopteris richardii]|uniref:Uncharacterized protein n=1 Tax=Ceratopteris richardii TaxID=49495 RepID=A0A8T2T946_CERRI|nr:hypothetical protein KP509_14G072000 [Ceratopteris richardii]